MHALGRKPTARDCKEIVTADGIVRPTALTKGERVVRIRRVAPGGWYSLSFDETYLP